MTDFHIPLREDLRGQVPYGAPQDSVQARLNVNENPFPPSLELCESISRAVREASATLNRYPDREAVKLRESLSTYIFRESNVQISCDQIWVANGSNEIMSHIFAAFGGPERSAITFPPTYSMYPEYARNSFTELSFVNRDDAFGINVDAACESIDNLRPSLVLIASPNNPTGNTIPIADLELIIDCARVRGALVVVDEAYAEFRREKTATAVTLLGTYPNLIVTRTLSKAFGFAGGRVGYCMASTPAIVEALMLVRLPYHISTLTQAAAVAALEHDSELQQQVQLLREERDRIEQALESMDIEVAPSDANFVYFGRFPNRHVIWEELFKRGVLIRETGPTQWLRASVGTPIENQLFLESLREVISSSR